VVWLEEGGYEFVSILRPRYIAVLLLLLYPIFYMTKINQMEVYDTFTPPPLVNMPMQGLCGYLIPRGPVFVAIVHYVPVCKSILGLMIGRFSDSNYRATIVCGVPMVKIPKRPSDQDIR